MYVELLETRIERMRKRISSPMTTETNLRLYNDNTHTLTSPSLASVARNVSYLHDRLPHEPNMVLS